MTGKVHQPRPTFLPRCNATNRKVKVKFSHTRYRTLGPELIPVYRQSPTGDIFSHPSSRLPLLSTRPASLPRKRSPDGASTNWGDKHLIVAYYSFIDLARMKGWVDQDMNTVLIVYGYMCYVTSSWPDITKSWQSSWALHRSTIMGSRKSTLHSTTTPHTQDRLRLYDMTARWSRSCFQSRRSVSTWRRKLDIVCTWVLSEMIKTARLLISSAEQTACLPKWSGRRSCDVGHSLFLLFHRHIFFGFCY